MRCPKCNQELTEKFKYKVLSAALSSRMGEYNNINRIDNIIFNSAINGKIDLVNRWSEENEGYNR